MARSFVEQSDAMLGDLLRDLKVTPAAYLSAARRIEAGTFKGLQPVKVAILSTFTSDILRPYLVVESAARGLLVTPYFAPFNQLEQQVFDGTSPIYQFGPDVVALATRIEEAAPNLISRFVALSPAEVEAELAGIEARLESLLEGLRRYTTASVFVFNYASPAYLAGGFADPFLTPSQSAVIRSANELAAKVCRKFTSVYVFDYARMVSEFGLQRWCDPKLFYLGRIPFGIEAQLETGRRLARYLRVTRLPACKCLVVDLDKTLWGGVLGEDGPQGIALGEDYPGNVYKDFQRKLLSLRDRGVLLAVASKNNVADVLEIFRTHPDCLLKEKDFAALQIHWDDKAKSLTAIARDLNIGTDALAFFDDSPVEREWIRLQMPEVTVIEVPTSPLGFAKALDESGAFDHLDISAEDRERPEMYQKERERQYLQARSVSVEEFLQQLDMTATIGYVSKENFPRVAQLISKTNQFNLTTRRRTPSELEAVIESGAVALWLRVADRFGDNGLVGVAIAAPAELGKWTVDTFLLSCRVIGRQVETVLLSILSSIVRKRGGQVLLGEYIRSPKNGLAAEFYPKHGFEPLDGDGRLWKWDLLRGVISYPKLLAVTFEGDPGYEG